jgi:hypothetical protein
VRNSKFQIPIALESRSAMPVTVCSFDNKGVIFYSHTKQFTELQNRKSSRSSSHYSCPGQSLIRYLAVLVIRFQVQFYPTRTLRSINVQNYALLVYLWKSSVLRRPGIYFAIQPLTSQSSISSALLHSTTYLLGRIIS